MLLKNHLIEVFKKASSENNILLKENIVLKWVHRFGIDSLNDLIIHSPALREYQLEEENQEQIKQESSKTFENIEETSWESKHLETVSSNGIFSKEQNSKNITELTDNQKLPLPKIKNLRKWINKSFKESIPNLCTHLRTIFSLSKILFSEEAFLKTSIRLFFKSINLLI